MDLQSFIESGLLESYVLGQGTAEERSLVERMLQQHAEVRTEKAAIEQALETYATAQATPPPAWMKGRILDQIEQLASAAPSTAPVAVRRPGILSYQLLTLACIAISAFLWYNNGQLQQQAAQLQTQTADLQTAVTACSQRAEQNKLIYALLRDSDTKAVEISSGKDIARVYYNPVREEIALDIRGVIAAPPGKHLQFWAIVDGKPVSLGMVQKAALEDWQAAKYYGHVEAFAISAENDPNGSAKPTQIVMIGKNT